MVKKTVNLLPTFFRTEKNSKFLSSTLDQLIQTPNFERLDGFVGSKLSVNYNPSTDQYISDPQELRTKYQLEPALVIKKLNGAIKKAYGYDDLINQVSFHGGKVDNLNRLFSPDFYSFDPQIDWDKLINFREYYWLPTGPDPIKITGTQRELISEFTVADSKDKNFFVFSPDGLTEDPQLILYRGVTYFFNVNTTNPLYFKKSANNGISDLYETDIEGNGTSNGIIKFSVTFTTPNVLYYGSGPDQPTGGQILIKTIDENSFINVDKEIVGKSQYTSGNGIKFINGMKVVFGGDVKPASYREKEFIVEGVGDQINLINYTSLETPEVVVENFDPDFDAESFDRFPFDDFRKIPGDPSYITINRASKDLNPWTRYNRWFHGDVLKQLALARGEIDALLPIDQRAKRPIIEFKPNLQLFNFGNKAINNVHYIDNFTTDVFSTVEKSLGYMVDGRLLDEGYRVIFNADLDPLVQGRIFEVTFVYIEGEKRINLVATEDNDPELGSCVTVSQGDTDAGTVWWLTTVTETHLGISKTIKKWVRGQQKTSLNQAPLFDVFDKNGYSYSNTPYTSNFRGTKIFGYAEGNVYDSVLGLNLKYKTDGLESSYLFSNYFNTDIISRVFPDISITLNTSEGFLKSNKDLNNITYLNVWTDAEDYQIPVIQFNVFYQSVDQIEVTVFDSPATILDLKINIFVNDIKLSQTEFATETQDEKLFINFVNTVKASTRGNRIRVEFYTATAPNSTGQYQTAINLTNNPLNGPVAELTLSELYDHLKTMVERDPNFTGVFPGSSNIAQLPFIAKYGTRIIANKNPIAFADYFIANREHSLIDAISHTNDDYNQFKLNLIKIISELEITDNPILALDTALNSLNENKNTTFPYLLSGMVPSGTNKKIRTYTVTDSRNKEYSISSVFDPTVENNKAILVYFNNVQLIINKDYTFDPYDATVILRVNLSKGDLVRIEEYLDTDGCYIAPTPSKLGLYPKFEPVIYTNTSYANNSVNVIQGHDGSLLVAFDDYRDNIILEFEKRIFNNIKTTYNPDLFDINSVLPGVFRNEEFSYNEIYSVIQNLFLKWAGFYGIDYEANNTYDIDNHKTYNFKSAIDYTFNKSLPGSWRAIYKYYFDTDRPDTHPWEMLGFYIKPEWWDSNYGPAPYTAGNLKLWKDLEKGLVAQGDTAGIKPLYARPGLLSIIPVDDSGNIVDPRNWAGLAKNDSIADTNQSWGFADWGPAENAWRRSSNWPFAVQIILALLKPADYSAKMFDTSRIIKNKAGQYNYGTDNKLLSPSILKIHSDVVDNGIVRTAGYSQLVVEHGKKRSNTYVTTLKEDLKHANFNLFVKLGGFVSQDKLSIAIDSVELGTKNPTPYLPNEDYTIHFNVSNPIKSIPISGVIVIKSNGKFIVRGYDRQNLYFKINKPIRQFADSYISIGSKSEEFVTWTANQLYIGGQIVYYGNAYYRVLADHRSSSVFNLSYYKAISSLPSIGGISVIKSNNFEKTETIVNYGTEYSTIQEVTDLLFGYGHWLESQGFIFDDYNEDFAQVINWEFTVKEFVYWTTQNWANNSVITLSPFANAIKLQFQEAVVDNIFDSFYEYSLLKSNGLSFPGNNFSIVRQGNTFEIKTKNTADGLFFAKLNLIQKEHALIFENKTIFNDIIYEVDSGYRQVRVKLKGFRTAEWNGDFFSPGFVYDQAETSVWQSYKDYIPGDVVQYVGKFYSAKSKITGTEKFDFNYWIPLGSQPVAQLIPNFDYKINQFEDFYSLDIDNFDLSQQKMAQHLIGYSPRSYFENIFDNPISQYKFYQGYIREKGTKNSIDKLAKATTTNLQGKIEYTEEWALRIGSFGSYSTFNEIELPLRERDFIENSQVIQFVDSIPVVSNDLTSYVRPSDLTIKPTDYDSTNAFKTLSETFSENSLKLPHAGYVRLDDVEYTYTSLSAITQTLDNSIFKEGDKFWIGFDGDSNWNVYRYTKQLRYIVGASQSGLTLTFTTNKYHGLSAGDLISVTRMNDGLNKVYLIDDIPNQTQFSVTTETASLIPNNLPNGVIFKFRSVRFTTIDDLADLENLAELNDNELFWVDDSQDEKWGVLKRVDNYDPIEYSAPRNKPGQRFGHRMVKQSTTSTVVVSADQFYDVTGGYGRIYVYESVGDSIRPITNYALNAYIDQYRRSYDPAGFGDNIVHDLTDNLIFVSAPMASYVKLDTSGSVRQARPENSFDTHQKVGLVKISGIWKSVNSANSEIPYLVLVNPETPQHGSRFGSGLLVQNQGITKRLLVGSPGMNADTGEVYRFDVHAVDTTRNLTGITGTNVSIGTTATFNITIQEKSREYLVSINNTGTEYTTATSVSSLITITGELLGGKAPDNNLYITVISTGTNGSIKSFRSSGTSVLKSVTVATTASQAKLPKSGGLMDTVTANSEFGFKITGDLNAERVAVAAPGYNNDTGAVYIFTLQSDVYTWVQTIKGTDSNYTGRIREGDRLGTEVKMSEQGDYLFVSSPNSADGYYRPGLVGVYKWEDTKFNFVQILNNPTRDPDLNFGFAIDANSSATILSVTSQGANLFLNTKFDGGLTTFDGGACLFGDKTKLSGTAYIYNRYKEKFLLAQELFDGSVDEGSYYGDSVLVDDNKVYIGSPGSITNLNHNGSVYMWNEVVPEINSWQIYRQQEELVDVSLIRNSTTIDSLNAVTIDYLDIVDPLKGRIPGLADQEIRYKTVFDPAVYNVGTSTVVVDANSFWGKNQVGELWWDISTTKYIWYEQGDLGYRKNTWGKLFPGVEISVYEWVKSEYLPSQYATLADTNEGLTAGISGQPKFPDDTVYSVTQTFDKQINQFTYSYYFWVKNKTVVPNEKGRKLSAFEVASLLTDPKSYGLKYLEIISKDAVSLVNFKSKLISDRIYLNISFDSMPTDVNKHTEWILIQEDSANSFPPKQIERKLIDSLLGKDSLGNIVPDPALPSRIKYGIEVRPRQSIFVDRKQALKNAIEYTNAVMKENLLRGFISFENLNSKDEIPDPLLGEYDVVFEDIEGKDTIITNKLRTAKLSCEITNGKVTNIIIDDPGYGYIIAPSITILASNDDVKLKSYIDSNGVITNVDIVNPGSRLTYIPKLTVRPFTIIVQVDPDFNNKWSKYEWIDNSWIRIYTQKFDTTRYWNYIDWQSSEFNSLKPVNYTVDEMYETNELVLEPGDYIKVVNPGDNLYMILRKTEDGVIGSFDNNFDILYKEQGTLFIKDSVWDTTTTQLGFDYKTTFDQLLYDESAEIELQNVLIAIKNNIFVDQLKLYWNKLFFKCLKYAFTEQKFLDWAFKTSFINVKNIAGVLDQRSTYRYQDPVWYESYIKEIKPYHTKIRNYQLNYQIGETNNTPWEPSNTYTTDFDLPAIYNRATKSFSVVEQGNSLMSTYPFKSWDDNTGHSIESITLISGGSGYRLTPVVDIIPAYGDTGFGAKAIAYIGLGKVTEIELIAGGSGYKQTPTIILRGGGDVNLETAVAYPNLTNKKVRSNIIQIKFDRTHSKTGSNREVGNLTFTDMFETTGNNYIFDLTWYASTDKRYITVTLDGIIVIETEYSINNFTKISDNSQYGDLYHKKFSQLVLTNVPTRGKVVEITYRKNIEIYSAAERIADFYNPKEGMPGKDLAQLMEGVEFPGVTVDGLQFSYSSFWDVQPFGESSWDDDGTSQVDLDTVIDGGAVTTGTTYENNAWAFTNARGIQPSDIILDGDKFISPYTSHAPEEVIPGQIQENISISVFTKEEQGSPLIVSQSVMIDSTLTSTVVGLRLQPVSTSSVMISFNSKALVYGKDYSLNFVNKTATINTQTTTGIAGITIIGVGGNELISSNVVTASGLTSTSIDSIVNYDDVGSLYVTSNGETLVESSTYGYTISPISTRNRRARVKINGLTTGTNVIQLWFFRSEYKGYSEVKEQIITLTENTSTIVLSQPPGTVGPLHAQAVVELNGLRLIPPDTTYYEVDGIQTVFPIKTDEPNIPGIYDLSRIEVHRNGIKIRGAQDYVLDQINGNIIFNPGYLAEGDVIAITSTINCDYRIEGSLLILSPTVLISQDDIIKIITYTNHDYSNIRTEVFLNSPSTRYRMDRAILNDNYVWVSVGGRPLTNGIDYQILSDGYTIKIHDAYPYVFDGKVVITSFTDVVASKSIGFRIIKDLLGRTHYKRYSELDTTYLDQPLAITDTKIYVVDSSILSTPNPQQNVPGIIYIEGERIEYFTKSDNVLGQIRRGTLGTGVKDNYEVGTPVVDHGQSQTVPYQDTVATWSTITNANTTTYSISGITFNNSVNTQDQVVVLYGGRVLNKNSYITHDYSMAYDSNEHNSDIENPPEFTITKELAGDGYVLNLGFNPNNNVKVRMAKLTGSIWYENGVDTASNGVSLLETNTIPARFLLERQSGLPDKYQYGQT